MTTIKVPQKAVVLIVGSPCSGKSFLAKTISAKTKSQDVASFSYGEGLKEYLVQTELMFKHSVRCTERLAMTNTGKIPEDEMQRFYIAADRQIADLARGHDFVVIDSDFCTIEKVRRMVAMLDAVRENKHLVLIKLAPELSVWEQLKKARYREFGKEAPNAPLDPSRMVAMPMKNDYDESIPMLRFNYGAPPPDRFAEYLVDNPFTIQLNFT